MSKPVILQYAQSPGGYVPDTAATVVEPDQQLIGLATLTDQITDQHYALEQLMAIRQVIVGQGAQRHLAQQVEAIAPGTLPARYPPQSFTMMPSATNQTVAMESIGGAILTGIKTVAQLLWDLLVKAYDWLKTRAGLVNDYTEAAHNQLERAQGLDAIIRDIESQLGPDEGDVIEFLRQSTTLEQARAVVASAQTELVTTVLARKDMSRALSGLSRDMERLLASLEARVKVYTGVIEQAAPGIGNAELQEYLDRLHTLIDPSLFANVGAVVRRLGGKGETTVDAALDLLEQVQKLGAVSKAPVSKWDFYETRGRDLMDAMVEIDPRLKATINGFGQFVDKQRKRTLTVKKISDDLIPSLDAASRWLTEAVTICNTVVATSLTINQQVATLVIRQTRYKDLVIRGYEQVLREKPQHAGVLARLSKAFSQYDRFLKGAK